jgi:cation transport ATPase
MLVIALVLGLAMTWNLMRHGRFEIGSLAGVSLLSKSLLLLEPADAADTPPPIAATIPAAVEARQLIGTQPDLAARIRAQFQAGSADLRWATFLPAAEASWPAWAAADWRERDQLVRPIALALILRHPLGFLQLWANDWLGLVLHPAYWPAWVTEEAADKRAFRACLLLDNCWGLDRYDLPVHGLVVMLSVSILGTLAALLVLLGGAWRVLRRRAAADTVVFWVAALVLQASLLVTSFFEAGHVRFTVAFHILDLALLAWLVTEFTRGLVPRLVTASACRRQWARS